MGDTLIVCAEAVQPLFCLNRDTGTTIWQLERPWEYERGFIGPSVWAHYIERFRLDRFDLDPEDVEAQRKKFDKQFSCAIVGGPVVVPLSLNRGWLDSHSIFVAVAKGPADGLSGYISDCAVYEFNDRGKPVSMVKLPYMLRGSARTVHKDGVVWKSQSEALVRIGVSQYDRAGMGPGGPDLLTPVTWLHRLSGSRPDAWLLADSACDAVGFGPTHAFCLPSGGYISSPSDSVYYFPLTAVDLGSGTEQLGTLHVPLEGTITAPQTNCSTRESPSGEMTIRACGPYLLGVTGLRVTGERLEITLGMEHWSASVRFDLSGLCSLRPHTVTDAEEKVITAWLKSLGNVNKQDDHGNTPLLNVSNNADARRVRALLRAGADVKLKSKTGWTPLMYAACYGTAEVVQLLIDAGSDVNARDENCGGQTVLIWAASGLRESKKKVEALLRANADRRPSVKGWNALMAAASHGQLSCVELLLQTGMEVNAKTKEGTTALMEAARQRENSGVVPVLLKSGADPRARDKGGRTPLMFAAQYGGPENISALIAAGADVDAKDDTGKTALDLVRRSNYVGAATRRRVLETAMAAKKEKK
jgi:ankyrin repeat protein